MNSVYDSDALSRMKMIEILESDQNKNATIVLKQ